MLALSWLNRPANELANSLGRFATTKLSKNLISGQNLPRAGRAVDSQGLGGAVRATPCPVDSKAGLCPANAIRRKL
jgi:hypothetical protein